jgi:dolichyl-phosphate-mannose-protein mannosyltransferase
MHLNKRDFVTIAMLSVIFFSVATWNLGLTQTPVTTTQFSNGQSFYLDLGNSSNVGSVYFLLKDGSYNLTVYSGSPENWHMVTSGATFSDYYKWNEISIRQQTQYIRVDFNESSSEPIIAEVAVTNSDNQQITIPNINNLESENPNVHNLIDEQDKVQLPSTYMSRTYFDEIYFVRTAEQYLHLQSPYEWTHPPLGKLFQAGGIVMFGFNPFGWRFMGVIFATLMIPIMYLLGKKLFGTWIGGFASAFLLTFDFMHFVMARIGTVDTYLVFFSLVSQLFFVVYLMDVLKKGWKASTLPLFLVVVFFALSFSTKWVALYGAVGMLALLVVLRIRDISQIKDRLAVKYAAFFDHPFLLLISFIAVAIGIYFATYIPDMLIGRPLLGTYGNGVIDLQFAMYHYHSTLTASAAGQFASAWWSWPLMLVPRWFDITYLPNSIDSTISVFGNPAVWWVGFAAILVVTERAIRGKELWTKLALDLKQFMFRSLGFVRNLWKNLTSRIDNFERKLPIFSNIFNFVMEKYSRRSATASDAPRRWDLAAIFIAVVFFFSWLPYVLISRLTYIYHFYLAMPFLCLASAYLINRYWHTRAGKIITVVYFASVVIMFIVFYPVISGMPVSTSWIYKLKWLSGWFFAP